MTVSEKGRAIGVDYERVRANCWAHAQVTAKFNRAFSFSRMVRASQVS